MLDLSNFGEQKQYPDGSVGWYTCHCYWCDDQFIGHKRDILCALCENSHCAITNRISQERVTELIRKMCLPRNLEIGFTCSSFDLLHAGHALMLKDCSTVCDYLVVGLQVNPSIDRDDKNSPIMSLVERLELLNSNAFVSRIIVYETDNDLLKLLTALKPNIRILGSDWKEKEDQIIGKDIAPIHWHDRSFHNYSTSNLRQRIYEAEKAKHDR